MWTWIRTFYDGMLGFLAPFWGKKRGTLIMIGLDHAGKSTLLFKLKEDRMAQLNPTQFPNSDSLTYGNVTFTAWDLGGHKQVRRVWRDYFPVADAILYLVDSSDRERFQESCTELKAILNDESTKNAAVAVLVNKIDEPGAAGAEEIVCEFGLYGSLTGKEARPRSELEGKRPLEVFPCSVLRGQGYGAALMWIANYF